MFPRNVERRTYRLRFSYVKGIPLAFDREEQLEGINTYVFSYRGRGEYTESYAGNPGMPGLSVRPGQEVRCADDQFALNMWIEPLTGETMKIEESCYSNDYLVEAATGKRLKVVDRWGGESAEDDIIQRAFQVRRSRFHYRLATYYLPAMLCAAGVLAVLAPLTRVRRLRRRSQPTAACPA